MGGSGSESMADKKFPQDCTNDCPHFHAWDMSVDDWTCVCNLLKIQIDLCDSDFKWAYCPKKTENEQTPVT